MWKGLEDFFKETEKPVEDKIVYVGVKEAKTEQQVTVPWREPVQSLIDSLEEGWWDYSFNYYTFKHEWLGTTFTLTKHYRNGFSLYEDWLTAGEKRRL